MKKYNTPEMKVTMFNSESVLTDSTAITTFNDFYAAADAKYETTWTELVNKGLDITF